MNCPNCGAENEAGARFCVSCGAPLETQVDRPVFPPELDDDRTILSSVSRISEEAKTVAVTSDQLASYEAESTSSAGYEAGSPSSFLPGAGESSSNSGGSSSGGGGFFTTRNIIIIVVVVLFLFICCCCSLMIGGVLANPELLEDLSLTLPSTWLWLA
jgi:hypothetical protein